MRNWNHLLSGNNGHNGATPSPPALAPLLRRDLLLPGLALVSALALLTMGGLYAINQWEREALRIGFFALLGGLFLLLLLIGRTRTVQLAKLRQTQRNMVFGLANLAELRDPNTGKHLERTRSYGVVLARALARLPKYRGRINEQFIADLYDAAPLHDLGKVGIPDRVLLKPGRLDQEEFKIIQNHSAIGGRLLLRIISKLEQPEPFLLMSHNIARHHHEKYNGSGYPDGLAGDDIPLEARIYALGDAYDAIRAKRPYKEPVTHLEAVQRIYASRGSHFDPDVTNAFLDCEEHFMEMFDSYQLYDDVYRIDGEGDEAGGGRGSSEQTVVWSPEFEVGVGVIDRQHKELITRINQLLAAIRQGRGGEESLALLRFLQEYVVEHFQTEEAYMRRHHYPDYAAHKEVHDTFIAEVDELVAKVEGDGVSSELVVQINRQVINWLVAHIFLVDKGLKQYQES